MLAAGPGGMPLPITRQHEAPDLEPVVNCVVESAAAGRFLINGKPYLNFSGAGYLALGAVHEIRQAALDAIYQGVPFAQQLPKPYGVRDPLFEDVEKLSAQIMGVEAALYFASGYLIGMIAVNVERQNNDHIFIDERAHQNLKDAVILSGLSAKRFLHRDPESLADVIAHALPPKARPLVVTDGVFAATGEVAPLDQYARVLSGYDGRMIIDDAHGFGVLGVSGAGAIEHFGVSSMSTQGGTFSKAFCAQGAVVGCSLEQAQRIERMAPKRGANAGSPISAAVAASALRFMQRHPDRRTRLIALADRLRRALRAIGIEAPSSPSNVVSFHLPTRQEMRRVQHHLFAKEIYLPISDYPGARVGGAFRASVFADHNEHDVDRLAAEIRTI